MGLAEDLLIELDTVQAVIEPELEGLRDYERLNIINVTRPLIVDAIDDYQRRLSLTQAVENSIKSLLDDGYPTLPVREIVKEAHDDLTLNFETVKAALAKFKSIDPAVSLNLTASTPIIK